MTAAAVSAHSQCRRRNDLCTDIRILVIGSGPIVIGQAAEFDYSGHAGGEGAEGGGLRGHPRELQSGDDHDRSGDRGPDVHRAGDAGVRRAGHRAEKPDALLPTMGGQTALNVAMELAERGVLEKYGVELIGAKARAIAIAEDREAVRARRCSASGSRSPQGGIATTLRRGARRSSRRSASRRSSGRRSRWAAPAAASRTIARSSRTIVRRGLDRVADEPGADRAER